MAEIELGYSNNVKDWVIRSVTSYCRLADYGRHSETERVLVSDEGLAIQSLLKIQSDPLGNIRDIVGRRNEFTYATRPRI
jgi:hypothetical protein